MLPKLCNIVVIAAALLLPTICLGQSASPASSGPPMKTIGQPSQAKSEVVPSLIVINARSATLQGDKLTLTGVSPNSIVFADRPVRAAGHVLTTQLLEEWSSGSESFGKDPPNATVSAVGKDATSIRDAVVVLKSPKLEGERLTFDVQVLEGTLAGAEGPTAVFIDIIGMPWTPLSFAGAARRAAYRGAFYAGAAAAVGAASYYHPYAPYYYRSACGYYPYPPCY